MNICITPYMWVLCAKIQQMIRRDLRDTTKEYIPINFFSRYNNSILKTDQ